MKDGSTYYGILGTVMAFVSQWLDTLNVLIQLIAGVGGLALLFYSIQVKRLEKRKLKKELNEKEDLSKEPV